MLFTGLLISKFRHFFNTKNSLKKKEAELGESAS
jgi:hypothetical protein